MRRRTFRTLAGGAAAGLAVSGLSLAVVAPASAATTEVGTEEELREAVAAANASPGLDRIVLATSITLSTLPTGEDDGPAAGDLDVTDTLEVIGNGETINAAGTDRDLRRAGRRPSSSSSDIVLRNGAPALESSGGAIRSLGTLAVVNSLLVDNAVTGPGRQRWRDLQRRRQPQRGHAPGSVATPPPGPAAPSRPLGGTTQVEGSRMTGNSDRPAARATAVRLHLTGAGDGRRDRHAASSTTWPPPRAAGSGTAAPAR